MFASSTATTEINFPPFFREIVVFSRVEKIFAQPAGADDDEMNKFGKHWKTENDLISPSAIRMIGCVSPGSFAYAHTAWNMPFSDEHWDVTQATTPPSFRRRIRMSEINQINLPTSTPLQKSSWRHENVGKILEQQREEKSKCVHTNEHWSTEVAEEMNWIDRFSYDKWVKHANSKQRERKVWIFFLCWLSSVSQEDVGGIQQTHGYSECDDGVPCQLVCVNVDVVSLALTLWLNSCSFD